MKLSKNIFIVILVVNAMVISACGGGGGSSGKATFTISGKVTSTANPAPGGETGVTVKAIYSDTGSANATSAADGSFSLKVEQNRSAYIQFSKSGFATLNSAIQVIDADVIGFDTDYPTTGEVQLIFDTALGGSTPIASKGWLVVNVTDPLTDTEVNGVSISSTVAPAREVYTLCDGTDSGGGATTGAPCVPEREVMYLGYFDVADRTVVGATGTIDTATAPINPGEITVVGFY